VAVVALLKELGASLQFNILIEGYIQFVEMNREALFNDGTAMVFFLFFANLAKGGESGVVPVI
jgi:NhaP-type Na+/H+ or K+/H+ antiporter